MPTITPGWLFARGRVEPCGTVAWGQPVPEAGSGVYVVTMSDLPVDGQHVVYIGRTNRLRRRLREFYRHAYGASAPHRGGQEILRLSGSKMVHWARAMSYAEAEQLMLDAFRAETGAWPYGNRMRSARMAPVPPIGISAARP